MTLLAGTDSSTFGPVAAEVAALIAGRLPVEDAVGAASWRARSFLGVRLIEDGAPADIVAFAADPLTDHEVLAHPARIILRGRVVR